MISVFNDKENIMNENDPILTIAAVTWGHSIHQLRIFLSSLIVQTNPLWKCILMHDGPWDMLLLTELEKEYEDPRIVFKNTETRENCYGHNLRDLMLENFINTEYLMFQNADNYLVPKAIELSIKEMQESNLNFLIFNCLHNYAGHWWGLPDYIALNVAPQTGHCDMGSFVIKTDLAKKVGFKSRAFHADGIFIDSVMATKPQWKKLDQSVLMVHN